MEILSALLGFGAPLLPELIGIGKGWLDHKQELAMMELRMQGAKDEHLWRMEEITAKTSAADLRSARKQRESYGVQLLNAAREAEGVIGKKTFGLVFFLFCMLDWTISFVRPSVTYYVVGIWGAIKWAVITESHRLTGDLVTALTRPEIWTDFDQNLMIMVMAFWFSDATLRRRRAGAR